MIKLVIRTKQLFYSYPAVRLIEIQSYGGPGQPNDVKGMVYGLLLGTKFYSVGYGVTPPEDFPRYYKLHNQ